MVSHTFSFFFMGKLARQKYLESREKTMVDEYGYTQTSSFDKFSFHFAYNPAMKNTTLYWLSRRFWRCKA
jgi:hypothetical protein